MKRFFALLLVLVCITSCAAADINFSNMTVAQLRDLVRQINAEIVSRPDWKETEVPRGHWVVGEDIPAGVYCVTPKSSALIRVWKKEVNNYKDSGLLYNEIASKDDPIGKLKLEDGWVFDTSDPVVFSPALSLGF